MPILAPRLRGSIVPSSTTSLLCNLFSALRRQNFSPGRTSAHPANSCGGRPGVLNFFSSQSTDNLKSSLIQVHTTPLRRKLLLKAFHPLLVFHLEYKVYNIILPI